MQSYNLDTSERLYIIYTFKNYTVELFLTDLKKGSVSVYTNVLVLMMAFAFAKRRTQ